MIEQAIRTLLLANAMIAQRVGSRVFADERPQGAALPSIEIWRVTGERFVHHGGLDGYTTARVQVDIWSTVAGVSARAAARQIADRVVEVLGGYRGDVGDVEIQGIFPVGDRAAMGEQSGGAPRVRGVQLDFNCHFREI